MFKRILLALVLLAGTAHAQELRRSGMVRYLQDKGILDANEVATGGGSGVTIATTSPMTGGATGSAFTLTVGPRLTTIGGLTRARGSLIVGGSSDWVATALGSTGKFFGTDGTDAAWHALTGTANQVTVTNTSGDLAISLPNAITLPGSLTAGGTITVGANTLALASATISGTPTWSSNQAITLSTASQPNVTSVGTLSGLTLGAGNALVWSARAQIQSTADGILVFENNGGTDFTRLCLGGTTSSFPALRHSGATLECVTADNAGFAAFSCQNLTLTASGTLTSTDGSAGTPSYHFATNTDRGIYNDTGNSGIGFAVGGGLKASLSATQLQLFTSINLNLASASTIAWSSRSVISSSADGMLTLTNAAATDFSRIQLGGTTSSFPAIRRNSTGADCVLADGSAYAMFGASVFSLAAGSRISNPSNTDGIVLISNNAGTAFTRLQLGGTGNSTAAFRPAGAGLDLVSGDASGYQPFGASSYNLGATTFLSNIATGVLGVGTAVGNSGGAIQVAGTGATHGEILKIESSSELLTLSTSGTTTDTSANLLPAGSIILAVDCRITTTITTATNWSVGDATTAARFSPSNSTLTSGTTSIGITQFGGSGVAGALQAAAAKVRITTTGTPGAGAIRITVHYIVLTAPTS